MTVWKVDCSPHSVLAYIITLLSSLVVSLTFTPVFGSLLLPRARMLEDAADPLLLRWLKAIVRRMLEFTLDHATLILSMVTLLVLSSCIALFWMGGEFLPPFNEGTLTISLRMEPGTILPKVNVWQSKSSSGFWR